MFQTISSFLPSTLQLSNDKAAQVTADAAKPQEAPQSEPTTAMQRAAEEQAVKRQKERKNESFIVVRPPPSKSNHPLNLQVQLVPPSNKDKEGRSSRPSSRHSMDSTVDSEVSLSRTPSNRSEASLYSSYSSTGSLSTLGSTSSTSSGRRMIIPLYNLQAHNVMQNVIVDAGTDAKIAKFMKRGLEVIGLAVLEPIEVWSGGSLDNDGRPRMSLDYAQGLLPPGSNTPTSSSAASLASESTHDPPAPVPIPAPVATPASISSSSGRPGTPRKFFGKLFSGKKKDTSSVGGPTPPVTPTSPIPQLSMDPRVSKRSSLLSAHGHPVLPSVSPEFPLQPPVLGIQPTLRSPVVPPRGRPYKYVWVVRKWLKGEPESMLGGMRDRFDVVRSSTLAPSGGIEANVEVRLEWTRGKKRAGEGERLVRKGSRRRSVGAGSSAMPSLQQPQTPVTPITPVTAGFVPSRKNRTRSPGDGGPGGRRSMDSVRSVSPGPAASITTGESNTQENPEDDGEESDPEDSETPWTCTLVVRRLHPIVNPQTPTPRSPLADEPAQPQSLRVKVAAVVPTPHHPKVVALLKVPFPLPDVEIEHVAVRRRIVTPAGLSRPAPDAVPESAGSGSGQKKFWSASGKENGSGRAEAGRASGIVLTAEELKDVVSCTGLWLVVREGFGGVGKERRKGDGWRLRG
ncbi:uncharacterized protein C8Q71DRAFT_769024 [Rhodofomes roseus]|uniref:Uncharacterized protein n=1 Tax=Rhodofomes roseus TaxID=34475 RepID=A0ABQ8KAP6_9APHY|nr:uncharacterized protein C8Q71DRAFT_769024 [Rhodofomes roseus]KAH9834469.1 hypothetical protein C8Q71DRAFT_769024 [Rhodofomes roseus]